MPNPKGHEDSIKDSRFKAAWQSGPTRTIRVPIALADATLQYARQLDRDTEPRDTSTIDKEEAVDPTEPPDTAQEVKAEISATVTEPRDTSKLQAELEDAKSEVQELRSHLDVEKKRGEEDEEVFWYLHRLWESSQKEVRRLQSELVNLKQKSVTAGKDFPEAADLLNQLKAKRKKSSATLTDVEKILEILEVATMKKQLEHLLEHFIDSQKALLAECLRGSGRLDKDTPDMPGISDADSLCQQFYHSIGQPVNVWVDGFPKDGIDWEVLRKELVALDKAWAEQMERKEAQDRADAIEVGRM